jgi:hypothetical protein
MLQDIRQRGATTLSLRASNTGEPSAELMADSSIPPRRVAAVVEGLLQGGIQTISIEVKK